MLHSPLVSPLPCFNLAKITQEQHTTHVMSSEVALLFQPAVNPNCIQFAQHLGFDMGLKLGMERDLPICFATQNGMGICPLVCRLVFAHNVYSSEWNRNLSMSYVTQNEK